MLAQTYPYHDKESNYFSALDFAYIKDEHGKRVLWGTSPQDATSLIALGTSCKLIEMDRKRNNELRIKIVDKVKGITYKDEDYEK